MGTDINPDIAKERLTASFSIEKLVNIVDGDVAATKRRREIEATVMKESLFTEGADYNFLSRDEQYGRSVEKAVRSWQLITKHGYLNRNDTNNFLSIAFPSESPAISLHWVMFLPTLQSQCNEEQLEKWMPLALSGQLIGTYAQTELGHGTNLRQLETTATFDPEADEFIIHCPTLTSMKWWPGSLGKSTNCCIVMAQLITGGKTYGMHGFFVQFRDLSDHHPLPGVSVGDIGPKFGYSSIDNGFLKFDHFRIPRGNMLMKHAQVRKDGTYVRTTRQKKPAYGVMTLTRAGIVHRNAFSALAKCCTIAIRYSAIRRQSELQPGAPEPQILDYQTQQYKLFPFLAMSYAYRFAAEHLWTLYDQGTAQAESGNTAMMPEIHALSSGLKAFCTAWTNIGMETCRLACGGHGYSHASGIPKIYVANTPACTYEGENTVLLLQTARYLLRCYQLTKSDRSGDNLPESVSYLAQRALPQTYLDGSVSLPHLVECFQYRAKKVIGRASDRVSRLQADGMEEWQARNLSGVEFTRAAEAHSALFVMRSFCEAIRSITDQGLAEVLTQLCQLLGLYWIDHHNGDYLEDDFMTSEQICIVRDKQSRLLAALRPNAVALVDAFDFRDIALSSVLGRYDGQVYKHLYEWAVKSPLNKTQVHESYHKYMKPMMTGGAKL